MNRAVAAIRPAVDPWGALSVAERIACLLRFGEKMCEYGEELAEIETLDGGLTASSAHSNVGKCIGWISEYCSFAAELKGTTYQAA